MMLCLPLGLSAQNTWEMPEQNSGVNPDQKYLAGAVPEVNGRVVFHTVIDAPGKSAAQVQDIVREYMQKMTKEANQFEQSRIVLIVDCYDGKADITMTHIRYLYDEERQPQTYNAEEWITDKEGLNKKQNKLARISGKFRRKTIDRKDFLFNKFAELLK